MSDLLAAARAEAARLQHDYIGTEHLLLALIQRGDPSLITILTAFGATPEPSGSGWRSAAPRARARPRTRRRSRSAPGRRRALDAGPGRGAAGRIPTPQHLLAALLAEGKGVVAASLGDLGIPVAKVREALGDRVATGASAGPSPAGAASTATERAEKSRERRRSGRHPSREKAGSRERGERRAGEERGARSRGAGTRPARTARAPERNARAPGARPAGPRSASPRPAPMARRGLPRCTSRS